MMLALFDIGPVNTWENNIQDASLKSWLARMDV